MARASTTLEWRAHGTVVLAAFAGTLISTINVYSTGVFIQPLQDAFGWSRAAITFGHVLNAVVCMLLSPVTGALADRVGPRWIGIGGACAICLLTAALGATGPSILSWWGVFALISLANTCVVPTIWTAAVAATFNAGRGLALATALSGASAGALVTPVLTVALIDGIGWRAAYPALAAIEGAFVLPALLLFFRGGGRRGSRAGEVAGTPPSLRAVAARDLANWRFARLCAATLLIAAVSVSFAATAFPILASRGLTRAEAAQVASVLGLAAIAGRLGVGVLLDRLPATLVASVAVLAPIVTCSLLLAPSVSPAMAITAVAFLGLALGAELDVVSYLTSRLFDPAHFGLIFGVIVSVVTVAGGAGPFLINLVFDRTGSYAGALTAAIPMCVASSLLFVSLRPSRDAAPR